MLKPLRPGYYYDAYGAVRRKESFISGLDAGIKTQVIECWRFQRNNTDAEIATHFKLPKTTVTAIIDAYIKTLKIGFKDGK